MKTVDDCHRHAIKRARERYGVWFTFAEMKAMSEKVKRNEALHLMTESRTRAHWLLDDQYIVVYNRKLHAIVTFLPPEAIYNYLKREAEGGKED